MSSKYIIAGNSISAKLWFPSLPWGGHQRDHIITHLNHLHIGAQVQPHSSTRLPHTHTRCSLPEIPFVRWHKQPHAYACHSMSLQDASPSLPTAHRAQVLMLGQGNVSTHYQPNHTHSDSSTSQRWPWAPASRQSLSTADASPSSMRSDISIRQLKHAGLMWLFISCFCMLSGRSERDG